MGYVEQEAAEKWTGHLCRGEKHGTGVDISSSNRIGKGKHPK